MFASLKRPARPTRVKRATVPRLEMLDGRLLLSGGVLDPTFGNGGLVTTANGRAFAVATYPNAGTANDGKIVAAGQGSLHNASYIAVFRYNLDGTPDQTFGGTGTVMTVAGGPAMAVAVQPDGKVLAAGWVGGDYTVVRYNADGTPDSTFGTKGKAALTFSKFSSDFVYNLVVQPDGKIVLAGETSSDGTNWNLGLMRLNANGSLDSSFGSGGKVITNLGSTLDTPFAWVHLTSLALDPSSSALDPNSGKLVIAARWGVGAEIIRYNTNGTVDTGFGSGGTGRVHLNLRNPAAIVQPDDHIVVVGIPSADGGFGVDRLSPDGTLDTSFGSGGVAVAPPPSPNASDAANCVTLQPDGKIVVGGRLDSSTSGAGFMAARFNTDGSLDTSFGTTGFATAPGTGRCEGVALEPDGRIVVVGVDSTLLARFLVSGPEIGSLAASPNPASAGSDLTLIAGSFSDSNPGASISQVAFYLDSNGDGVLDSGDALLGSGALNADGTWRFKLSTTGFASGTYTFFALATDSDGSQGSPVATTDQVL